MATTDYKINSSGMSIGPFSIKWMPTTIGVALNGRGIYSSFYNIIMQFEGGSIPHVWQWIDNVSAGSFNATVLDRNQLAFTDLSGVNAEITEWPDIQNVNAGNFTIVLRGAI